MSNAISRQRRPLQIRVLFVAAVASCLFAQAPAAATRNFLWKVSGKQTAIYLVGSVHMLTKDYYPLNPALDTAFKDSDLLVEEVDMAEMQSPAAQLAMVTRGMLTGGQSLEAVVSKDTYALVSKRAAAVGIPVEPLRLLKPWTVALLLLALEWQKAGFDPELGLDKHFFDRAQADQKAVKGLETVEYQLSRFDEMTPNQQDRLLADTLKGLETEMANVSKLADAWKSGDSPTVERIVLADLKSDPVMYQRLLVERNRNWLPQIEALFTRKGRAFVVVGAAHLVGADGLIAMLKAKGYAVEQM